MKLSQNWVGYLDRSYEQIKSSILKKLSSLSPEITDYSESNPLIIIASMFSGVGEMLNLYVDSKAREAFLGTCRRYASAVKIVKLIDYNIKARGYATVTLLFTLRDSLGVPVVHTTDITIPKDTIVSAPGSAINFRTIQTTVLPAGQSGVYVLAAQYSEVLGVNLGLTNGTALQHIPLPFNYVHNSLKVTILTQPWSLYNSFGQMLATTQGFVVDIDEDKNAFLIFGDNINGKIPTTTSTILADYRVCDGISGNVPPNSLTEINTPLGVPTGLAVTVTNPDYASGGTEFEGLEDIRNRAPRSIRTLDRAVTYQDYIDLALQVLGVGAAEVSYCCGKYVDMYIAPSSKGVATQALLNLVRDYLNCRKMITTQVDVKPAGTTRIWLQGKIYGKSLYTESQIQKDVLDTLDLNFGIAETKINKIVSITDIVAVLENCKTVDTAEIEKVKIEPFARPIGNNLNILNITWSVLPTSNTRWTYTLIYKSVSNNFQLYKAGVFQANITIGTPYADGTLISFTIAAGVYNDSDKWEFTVFPSYPEIFPSTKIDIRDYSAPVIDVSPDIDGVTPRTIFSNLTFITQGASSSCLPPCN